MSLSSHPTLRIVFLLLPALLLLFAPPLPAQAPYPGSQQQPVFPPPSAARAQVAQAMKLGEEQNRRILIDFGNDQSPDCQVLEQYLREQPIQTEIAQHFLIVHINVGKKFNQNRDLAERFGIPLQKGVPAFAVIDSTGHVLFSQSDGEFTNARTLSLKDLTDFLDRWRS